MILISEPLTRGTYSCGCLDSHSVSGGVEWVQGHSTKGELTCKCPLTRCVLIPCHSTALITDHCISSPQHHTLTQWTQLPVLRCGRGGWMVGVVDSRSNYQQPPPSTRNWVIQVNTFRRVSSAILHSNGYIASRHVWTHTQHTQSLC